MGAEMRKPSQSAISRIMSAFGRQSGKNMTAEQRSARGRKAVQAREARKADRLAAGNNSKVTAILNTELPPGIEHACTVAGFAVDVKPGSTCPYCERVIE